MVRRTLLILACAAAFHAPARGQGIYADVPIPPWHPPEVVPPQRPPAQEGARLILESHRITGTVREALADWKIDQVFLNPSDRTIEGVYLFPIPRDAIARGVTLTIGGKEVAGEVLDADKAREIYRDIVRRARDPALLEYAGQGMLRASVFPIGPRARVHVGLEFATAAERVGDVYAVSLPLRFAAEAGAQVVVDLALESAHPFTTIYSPTHAVDVARPAPGTARVSFEGKTQGRDDLRLYYAMAGGAGEPGVDLMLLTHRLPAQDGTFVLVLTPRCGAKADAAPRDVVFVLDRSGSMAGAKWDQAVRALRSGLATLRPHDRFALLTFATDVRVYKDGLVPATEAEVAGAAAHLEQLRPAGGTHIAGALEAALARLGQEPLRLRMVTFLTDGLPTIGEVDPERILAGVKASGADARLFTFGLGYDVNTWLLDRLAQDNRGASGYVAEGEDLEVPVAAFFAKVAEPVLVAPELRFQGGEVHDVYPQQLPDLFAGGSLVVTGRYRGQGPAAVTLRGRSGQTERSFSEDVSWPADDRRHRALPALWAARKVGFLLDQIRLHGANRELVDAVIALGREHGIVTPYTAGLVVEEGVALGRASGVLRDDVLPPGSAPAADSRAREQLKDLDLDAPGAEAKAAGEKAVVTAVAIRRLVDAVSRSEGAAVAQADGLAVEYLEAAGRRLVRMNGIVVDRAFRAEMREGMTEIETYSDAWFALMDADPALRELLALGENVLFVRDGKAIWVHP